MRDINRNSHISKMKAITQADKSKGNNMMQHQLLEILSRLLQLQHQHQALLCPIRSLEQIVRFEVRLMRAVREASVHASGIEIPHRRARHDEQAERSSDGEIDGCVELFHKPALFASPSDSATDCYRSDHPLHEEFAP